MDALSIRDSKVQARISGLAQILLRKVRIAKDLVAIKMSLSYSRASVYRMFAGKQPWAEVVARQVLDLLGVHGLVGPQLWERLFQVVDLPELSADQLSPIVVFPNPTSVKSFHLGIERPTERSAAVVITFADCLPPEFLTPAIRLVQMPLWTSLRKQTRRGITMWGSSRRRALSVVPVKRSMFISEPLLVQVFNSWRGADHPTKRQVQTFYHKLARELSADTWVRLGLIDTSQLSADAAVLLRGQMHSLVGSLSNPVLRVRWSHADPTIHYWREDNDGGAPIVSEKEANLLERVTSTLTHQRGVEECLDRLSLVAHDAELEQRCDWI